jgi:hypothetical protein
MGAPEPGQLSSPFPAAMTPLPTGRPGLRPRRLRSRAAVLATLLFASTALGGCRRAPAPADPQLVAQWLRASLAFVRTERLGPPVAARISAYGATALYEGLAADPRSGLRSMGGQLNGLPALPAPRDGKAVDGATVAATAEAIVLDSLFRDGFASTRRTIDSLAASQVAARREAGVDDELRERSERHGRELAAAILAWAAGDGFFATRGKAWTAAVATGTWVNTTTTDQFVPHGLSGESDVVLVGNPGVALDASRASERQLFVNRPKDANPRTTLPAFNPTKPTEPYWGTLRPIALDAADQCPAGSAVAYSDDRGSAFWKMAQELYDSVKVVTPEKREIALFWSDNPVATGTPAFHWTSVINQMIARRGLDAEQSAELYALSSIAMHDAFIGCWKSKYEVMGVRPVAYVRAHLDSAWQPLFATPPFPEYPSGHSTISAAAARVLIGTLGDTIPFVDSTQVDIGRAPRAFRSFSHARDEVAVSRVYGGIHFVPAVVDGVTQGECIGRRVLARVRTRK